MNYSQYQLSIFNSVRSTNNNLMIEAVAGSGKTTTIIEAAKLVPPNKSCLFLAFNKAVADTLKDRLPKNVKAQTLNSLGWNICSKNIPWFKTNENKTRNLYYYKLNNFDSLTANQKVSLYQNKEDLEIYISLLKAYECCTGEDFERLIPFISSHYSLDLPDRELLSDIRKCFVMGASEFKTLDFDDQIYLSAIHSEWVVPQYDVVFVDEAQDLSNIQASLIKRVLSPTGRVIFVGDSNQAIYGFRGASVDSISNLTKQFDCERLPLSISYRCASSIVERAKEICPQIEPSSSAPRGKCEYAQDYIQQISNQDLLICRTISPLRNSLKKLILSGKKVNFCYPELLRELTDISTNIKSKYGYLTPDRVLTCADSKQDELLRRGKKRKVAEMLEKYQLLSTIVGLYPHETNYTHLMTSVLQDAQGVKLMSIHKAKGLESQRVFFLNPDQIPHKNASLPWEIKQEYNMKYVGITRAKEELYYAQEQE